MARRAFFSFHYNDVSSFRANVVRQSWVTHDRGRQDTFFDNSIWEKAQTKGTDAIKELIEVGMKGSTVTVVLIGEGTHERRWVKYEILKSFERGNGILGIHINRIRGKDGYITSRGLNPLERLKFLVSPDGTKIHFFELVDQKWRGNGDLPQINNKKSNSFYYPEGFIFKNSDWGKSFLFSNHFKTYCWDKDNGYKNLPDWVEQAGESVKKDSW
jgi:hypothetical protein